MLLRNIKKHENKTFPAGFIALCSAFLLVLLLSTPPFSYAATKIIIDDNKSISMTLGLRSNFSITEKGAPNGTSSSKSFNIESMSIYLDSTFNDHIKMTLNAERNGDDGLSVLDAIAKFDLHNNFNLWFGRMHPPSDRSMLSGPFFTNVWEPAVVVSRYPGLAFDRDNGVLIWGKPAEGMFVYSAGIFNGSNRAAGGSNDSDSFLYASRIAINFFDPEPTPAYYVSNTYYGNKRILTLGAAYQFQKNGVGLSPSDKDDFQGWNVDLLFEDKVGTGVLTAEAAYYNYDLGGQVDCNSGEPGSIPCANGENMGLQVEGTGYLVTLAYLIPNHIGAGRLQPFFRQQKFDRDISRTTNEQIDLGVNYVINNHDARISAVYSQLKDDRLTSGNENIDKFTIGFQLMY